ALKTFENSTDHAGLILGGLNVARDTKEAVAGSNNILNLSYRGPVAEDCGKIVSATIESYQEFLDITYRNASDQTLDLIQKARDLLKTDLAKSEEKYLKFRQETSLFWKNKEGVNVQLERVVSLEAKRTAMLVKQDEMQNRIEFLDQALKEGKGREALL